MNATTPTALPPSFAPLAAPPSLGALPSVSSGDRAFSWSVPAPVRRIDGSHVLELAAPAPAPLPLPPRIAPFFSLGLSIVGNTAMVLGSAYAVRGYFGSETPALVGGSVAIALGTASLSWAIRGGYAICSAADKRRARVGAAAVLLGALAAGASYGVYEYGLKFAPGWSRIAPIPTLFLGSFAVQWGTADLYAYSQTLRGPLPLPGREVFKRAVSASGIGIAVAYCLTNPTSFDSEVEQYWNPVIGRVVLPFANALLTLSNGLSRLDHLEGTARVGREAAAARPRSVVPSALFGLGITGKILAIFGAASFAGGTSPGGIAATTIGSSITVGVMGGFSRELSRLQGTRYTLALEATLAAALAGLGVATYFYQDDSAAFTRGITAGPIAVSIGVIMLCMSLNFGHSSRAYGLPPLGRHNESVRRIAHGCATALPLAWGLTRPAVYHLPDYAAAVPMLNEALMSAVLALAVIAFGFHRADTFTLDEL